ncbi:PopZ family protein [Bradyrhizobium sp. HKCCYLS1011]|uniref:PopZ family protein n=1 Tax=Bradyrhizobium sp. HKCCYLS1011 TaxID=3420733 RepID=UPI003EBB36B3
MTQPAKVQEPSMEEILASIRRIIADDEAKPPAAEKAAAAPAPPPKAEKPAPAPKPPMSDIPPSKIPAAVAAAAKAAPPPAPSPPPAAASNNQDDIDALLAGLDETTSAEEIRPAEPEPEPDVLELTDDMAVAPPTPAPSPAPASFRRVDPQDDIEFVERAAHRVAPASPAFESAFEPVVPKQAILSTTTVNAVESAFNALANTVLSNNARTLEDLVKEMLRPMLKSWLDDNLPALVERIVKAEIERVSRGR